MTLKPQELWDEFDWEKELRKDDERIHTYFRELPDLIDFPSEDELIFKRIKCREDLVPHNGVWPSQFRDPEENMEEDFDLDPMTLMRDKAFLSSAGGPTLFICTRQMKKLAMICIVDPALAKSDEMLRLHCLVSKLTGTLIHIFGLRPSELPALRIALCKRSLAIVNEIYGCLNVLKEKETNEEAEYLIKHVSSRYGLIRDKILGFLGKLRNPASGEEENSFWGDIDPSDLPF